MPESIKFNLQDIEAERETAAKVVGQLGKHGAIITPDTRDAGALAFKVQFPFTEEGAVVTVRIALKEWQTDSDVVITNMTTLPFDKTSLGLGSIALRFILDWAAENNLREVRAAQVSDERSEKFWKDKGFALGEEPNPTHDFIYRKPERNSSEDAAPII